ncbi:MAG TPA: hypothetical protein ENK06_13665 [Gammaproteobacteria bacterium]|nr:hypothetical protein [Gammaproteobacteria bacterium]
MPDRLPIFVNPEHAAIRGFRTSGRLMLQNMARLQDRLLAPYGEVEVDLVFGKQGRRMYLAGTLSGWAALQCQRCLQKMTMDIATEFRLGFVFSEAEIDGLLPGEEPLLIDADNKDALRLASVIEDELELLLPMVIKHPEGQCQSGAEPAQETAKKELKTSRKNPFDVLVDLKKH